MSHATPLPPALDLDDLAARTAPQACTDMAEVRDGVDRLDRALVALIAERTRYMAAAARIKPGRDAVRDEARIEDVVEKVCRAAAAAGLPVTLAEPVWRELVEQSIAYELDVFDRTRS
jgi:isochorismate pyruvate lyase